MTQDDGSAELSYLGFLREGRGEGLPQPEGQTPEQQASALRDDLAGYSEDQRDAVDPYIRVCFNMQRPQGMNRSDSPSEWLANRATPEQAAAFLERHAAILQEQRADPRINRGFNHFRDATVRRLNELAAQGWVNLAALDSGIGRVRRIQNATLHIGDFRETHALGESSGYESSPNQVVIGQGMAPDPRNRQQEVMDRMFEATPRELCRVFGRGMASWARNATVEHLGLAVRTGDPAYIDPATRRRGSQGDYYGDQRQLLATVIYQGPNAPHNTRVARTFFRAATSRSLDTREWHEFNDELDSSWGFKNAWRTINQAVSAHEAHLSEEYPDEPAIVIEQWASELTARDLTEEPRRVFGDKYQMPRNGQAVGATAIRSER